MSCMLRVALFLSLAIGSSPVFARSNLMEPASDPAPKPEPGKALVIFMRPSFYGGAISSSIYDAPDSGDSLIGVLKYKDKVAYQAEPGTHRFMVIAENADFLDATLEADKTYEVLVKARPGAWKARFSLIPIHNDAQAEYNVQSADFAKWSSGTNLVQKTPGAEAWYTENKASIDEKKASYLQKWNRMDAVDRAVLVLHPQDGMPAGE